MTELSENFAENQDADLNWENRRLCSDESCIGTIGTDDRCRICGRLCPNVTESPDMVASINHIEDTTHGLPSADLFSETQASGFQDRTLCRDESCIGTIGTDGRCRICGLAG